MLAQAFGGPKSRVTLIKGARSRTKQFRIVEPAVIPAGFEGR